jgi:hypothetical protein
MTTATMGCEVRLRAPRQRNERRRPRQVGVLSAEPRLRKRDRDVGSDGQELRNRSCPWLGLWTQEHRGNGQVGRHFSVVRWRRKNDFSYKALPHPAHAQPDAMLGRHRGAHQQRAGTNDCSEVDAGVVITAVTRPLPTTGDLSRQHYIFLNALVAAMMGTPETTPDARRLTARPWSPEMRAPESPLWRSG